MNTGGVPPIVLTVTGLKGGAGKTLTAIHLAQYLSEKGPTLLVDADDANRTALNWAERGDAKPFAVIHQSEAAMESWKYRYIVIDTRGTPKTEDLKAVIRGSKLIVIPTFWEGNYVESAISLANSFRTLGAINYRLLLANVPPPPQHEAESVAQMLTELGFPVLKTQIRSYKAFKRALTTGCFVDQLRDDSRAISGALDFENLGKEIDAIIASTAAPTLTQPAVPAAKE